MLKILQGLLRLFYRFEISFYFFSTVQPVHQPTNDDNDDDDDRPFTLNDGDEASDDDQLDDNEHEKISNQHIRDNFQVDNERGMKNTFIIILIFIV